MTPLATKEGVVWVKMKSWVWWLTFPFAHNNFTTFGMTIYCPRLFPNDQVLEHELIHVRQQKIHGKWRFLFLYLFCLPFRYNAYRWRWEYEAYLYGSKMKPASIDEVLSSVSYGWLRKPS